MYTPEMWYSDDQGVRPWRWIEWSVRPGGVDMSWLWPVFTRWITRASPISFMSRVSNRLENSPFSILGKIHQIPGGRENFLFSLLFQIIRSKQIRVSPSWWICTSHGAPTISFDHSRKLSDIIHRHNSVMTFCCIGFHQWSRVGVDS